MRIGTRSYDEQHYVERIDATVLSPPYFFGFGVDDFIAID